MMTQQESAVGGVARSGWRAAGLIAFGMTLLAGPGSGAPMPDSFATLIERVKPAVVTIATTELQPSSDEGAMPQPPTVPRGSPLERFFNERRKHRPQPALRLTALGSGFIIDAAGLVVTNNHVVANGTDIQVTLHARSRRADRSGVAQDRRRSPASRGRAG
jgi:serine protease Do